MDGLAKGVYRVGLGSLNLSCRVALQKRLLGVAEESEGLLTFVLFVSHAEDNDSVLADVVKEELVQLPRLHGVRLHAWHQLRADVVEVPHVTREIAQYYIAATCALSN